MLNKKQDANKLLEQIATEMGGDKYQNTQGIAWALLAVSHYLGGDTSHFSAMLTQDGNVKEINSDKPISTITLAKADANVSVKNTSGLKLFATLVTSGVPIAGDEKSLEKGFKLEINYDVRDKEDSNVWNSMKNQTLLQGSDVRIKVSISNTSNHNTDNIALTIPVAAGMEIASTTEQTLTKSKYDYRDIRDDRVHYYFSLAKGKTKTFYLMANASYKGRYYLPAINVEAMYDGNMKARKKGQWINIANGSASGGTANHNASKPDVKKLIGKQVSIKSLRAWLYNKADETTRTKMYVIVGDKVKVLKTAKGDNNSEWLFIHFKGKKVLEKWIKKETIE